jgi:GNAT superfamily N-acetyltransferase
MAHPTLRQAAADDVPDILPIINAAFAVETFVEGPRATPALILEMMETGSFLLAHDASGRLVATLYLELRGSRGYFGMLAVDPAQQRAGLGRFMVAAAEARLREAGCSESEILVLSLRPELLPYYERLGYTERERAPFKPFRALKDGLTCDGVVLRRRLVK